MQQLRGSVFSLTLMSKGEKRTGVPLLPSMPKGEIVGRFTVGSKLVIDGKNNDGKDQRWKRTTMERTTKSRSDEIARWTKSRMAKSRRWTKSREKQRNREVAKSREDLGRRIWGIYEGSIAIRYGEAARRISPRVIQLPKTVKESWPSIGDSRGPLIHRTRGERSSCR
jgi:hypothetical protein